MNCNWDPNFRNNWSAYSMEQIRELYDRANLTRWKRSFSKEDVLWLIERIPEWPDIALVDVGCNKGQMARFLHGKGLRWYFGIDVSDVALETARLKTSTLIKWKHIQFLQAFIEDLVSFVPQHDVVLCSHTLEHVIDLQVTIENMKLMSSKYLAIIVPMQMKIGGKNYHTQLFPNVSSLIDAIGLDQYQVDVRIPPHGRRIIRYLGVVN